MYAFGMLGSYFSQGVYAVAGPFQGAVDIIVVQQEDGSFKSSPWYVKCGDFQGVLTRKEKIVDISVNGVPADFYMLLNSRGEAYFEKEVEDAVLALPSTSSSIQGTEENRKPEGWGNSKSLVLKEGPQVQENISVDANGSTQGNDTDQIRGRWDDFVSTSPSEVREPSSAVDGSTQGNGTDQIRGRWDDLVSTSPSKVREHSSAVDGSLGSSIDQSAGPSVCQASEQQELEGVKYARERAAISRDTSGLNATNCSDRFCVTSEETSELRDISDSHLEGKPVVINASGENLILAAASSVFPKQLADEERPPLQRTSNVEPDVQTSKDGDRPGLLVLNDEVVNPILSSLGTDEALMCNLNTVITEDWFGLQKASSFESGDDTTCIQNDLETSNAKAMEELVWNDFKIATDEEERELHGALITASTLGVRLDGESWKSDMEDGKDSEQVDSSVWVSGALVEATSNIAVAMTQHSILMQERGGNTSTDSVTLDKNVVCKVEEGPPTEGNKVAEIPTIAVVPPSRWTMWPLSLRRPRAERAPASETAATKQAFMAATRMAVASPLTEEILRKNGYYEWTQKPKLRSYVPTSAQIESLKLKDGPNKVTFTFPRVLGRTQVDANIYLWKWNTRIVISDVDGTITKSDVLGQFMPLVGRDWSQFGVTRLFSSIKENGYEVLFLSARAISQAYLTRQFLVNLKQDGETLPEGPVFISPDGLIPSLYREVVRRTPHEFKISCLEGIRRLFPNDVNPFYAGFGNRDTDEISYLKVGIPKGKIFIINPKGEVVVNHHVDVKSYTSIHALVDDMFPPVYSSEQEDFNTWNYWKLPLPEIVDELSAKSSKAKKGGSSKK